MEATKMRKLVEILPIALIACGKVTTPEIGGDASSGEGPTIALSGHMHDERGDAIDFSSGAPVHTHSGGSIDLGSGCPDVYKFAYLMDPTEPVFGSEVSANPIAWTVTTSSNAGIDDQSYAFRVRREDMTVVRDWTPITVDANGGASVTLYRSGPHGIPDLATTEGKLYVDVRVRDKLGIEADASGCWVHHPLAAPLEMALHEGSLFGMTLGRSYVSSVLGGADLAPDVFAIDIYQTTNEPVTFRYFFSPPAAQLSARVGYRRVLVDSSAASGSRYCSNSPSPECSTSPLPMTTTTLRSGLLASGTWSVVADDVSGAALACTVIDAFTGICTIPGRAANEPAPHHYFIWLRLSDVTQLWPSATGPFGEGPLPDGTIVTSDVPVTLGQCTAMSNSTCTQWTDYSYFNALMSVDLYFQPEMASLQTRPSEAVGFQDATYVDPTQREILFSEWMTSQQLP